MSVKKIETLLQPKEESKKICRYCKRKFGRTNAKTFHENKCFMNPTSLAKEKRMFNCNDCGYSSNQKKQFIRHKSSDCGVMHKCKKCDKIYSTLANLMRHYRLTECKK